MQAAILIVSINTGAYMAEIVRGGIISIDRGQTEAARSIGMTHWQTMVIGGAAAGGAQHHALHRQRVRGQHQGFFGSQRHLRDRAVLPGQSPPPAPIYRYFETFFIIAVIYLILTFTVTRILRLIEKKMDGPDNYVICGSQSDSRAAIRVDTSKKEA